MFRRFAWALLQFLGVADIVRLWRGALKDCGWIRSAKSRASIDAQGDPLPWITYPAIYLLDSRVKSHFRVFEFGSGNSTLWWSRRVASVRSTEHDKAWFEVMIDLVPGNVNLSYIPLERDGAYCRSAQKDGPFDIIVVDGRDRVNCIKNSLASLSETGVIVLDNSEREEYREGIEFLTGHGFRQLALRGLGPIVPYFFDTSLFYRDRNVLGL